MKKLLVGIALAFAVCFAGRDCSADSIYVIDTGWSGYQSVTAAKSYLTSFGHTVTSGNALGSYSAFSQVWDLRISTNLTATDFTAMGNFLQSGGSMYLAGDNAFYFSSRNNSLVAFMGAVGAGSAALGNMNFSGFQQFTTAGQIVNAPNNLPGIQYAAAETVFTNSLSQGFLVTQAGSFGSMAGWDFGDITGASNARMLIGLDINIFDYNSPALTQNLASYLGASPPAVPTPSAFAALLGMGAVGFVGVARRRWKKS